MSGLPVCLAGELEACPEEQRWLIEQLWSERGVGILGGEPKLGKSWLALDVAVSVASGAPCLRRFAFGAHEKWATCAHEKWATQRAVLHTRSAS